MAKAILEEKISESGIVKLIDELAVETTYTKKVSGISIDEIEDRFDYKDIDLEEKELDPTIRALAVIAEGLKYFRETLSIDMFRGYYGAGINFHIYGDQVDEFDADYGFAEELFLGATNNKNLFWQLPYFLTEYEPSDFNIELEIQYVAHEDDIGYGMEEPDGYETSYMKHKKLKEQRQKKEEEERKAREETQDSDEESSEESYEESSENSYEESYEDSDGESDESSYYSEDIIWDRQSTTFQRIVEKPIDAFINHVIDHFNAQIRYSTEYNFR